MLKKLTLNTTFFLHVPQSSSRIRTNQPESVRPVYQCGDEFLRSIHVDSEPKVVRRVLSNLKENVRDGNVILGRRGRGTNWALGYHGIKGHEDHLLSQTIEMVRKEAERCDSFSGIIMMHSLSGGTGSGLGSRLCESLRDEFGISYLMSCVVAPHASGESPLQHYNTLLCLDSLQRHSDSIILFHNDEVIHQLQKSARGKAADAAISFTKMNQHIATCLSGVLLPVDTITPKSGVSIGMEPWEMLRTVTPMPHLKFASVNTLSRNKLSWNNLAGLFTHTSKRYNEVGDHYAALSALLVARGDSVGDFYAHKQAVHDKIQSTYNCVSWNPFPIDIWTGKHNHVGSRDSASITVCANYSSVRDHIRTVINGAQEKYTVGAYLHWYWKHGCEKGDFEQAFETLNQVEADYRDAIS